MYMDKEILTEIGGATGKIKEVGTNANGNVMGQTNRLRVSVDITKPQTMLKNRVWILEQPRSENPQRGAFIARR